MTTSDPGPGSRLPVLAGHYSFPHMFGAVALLSVATAATGNHIAPLRWGTTVTLLIWLFVQTIAGDHHEQQLCGRCAAKMPLDGQARADKRERVLWWKHQYLMQLGVLALIVAAVLLPWHPAGWLRWTADGAGLAAATTFYVAETVHRRLRPWCPFCKPWGGGDDGEPELSPEPDPDPAVSL